MKKLLCIFTVLNLTASSVININMKIKNNNQNLQDAETINKANANEFGDLHHLVPSTAHRYHWYLRFYMTPAIYNMFLLTIKQSLHFWRNPTSRFYNLFLGNGSEKSYPTWYNNAVVQYNEIIKQYDAFYHIDFSSVFKLWLEKNYKYFYDVFLGKTYSTNICDYLDMPDDPTPKQREKFLQTEWRKTGVVMNIPFAYNRDLTTQNKWTIDENNLRMFPQEKGVRPLFYYYSEPFVSDPLLAPVLILPNETGESFVPADQPQVKRDIIRVYLSALNPPQNLRERHYYKISPASLKDKTIHDIGGGAATPIAFRFGLERPAGQFYKSLFYIRFYLANPPTFSRH